LTSVRVTANTVVRVIGSTVATLAVAPLPAPEVYF
jgi:hypothetical protein